MFSFNHLMLFFYKVIHYLFPQTILLGFLHVFLRFFSHFSSDILRQSSWFLKNLIQSHFSIFLKDERIDFVKVVYISLNYTFLNTNFAHFEEIKDFKNDNEP